MADTKAVKKSIHESNRSEVGSLLRGMAVLDALAGHPHGASPQELIGETDLDRSTLQRLLRTLVAAGYAERLSRGRYAIGTPSLSLGAKLTQGHHLARVSRSYLLELQSEVGETVNLAVLDGVDILYVSRLATGQILSINIDIGTRLPAYCTSLGRAILAFLPEDRVRSILSQSDLRNLTEGTKTTVDDILAEVNLVRQRGFALTEDELEVGLRSIAAPVLAAGGTALGAINISVPAARVSGNELTEVMAPALVRTAKELSLELGAPEEAWET